MSSSKPTPQDIERAWKYLSGRICGTHVHGSIEGLATEFAAVREETQRERDVWWGKTLCPDVSPVQLDPEVHREAAIATAECNEARVRQLETDLENAREDLAIMQADLERTQNAEAEVERLRAVVDDRDLRIVSARGRICEAEADLAALKERNERLVEVAAEDA